MSAMILITVKTTTIITIIMHGVLLYYIIFILMTWGIKKNSFIYFLQDVETGWLVSLLTLYRTEELQTSFVVSRRPNESLDTDC